MSKQQEMQIEQGFVVINGTKHNISRELSGALGREKKRLEEQQNRDAKRLTDAITELTKTPVEVKTLAMTMSAKMRRDGSMESYSITPHPNIANNLNAMVEHTVRCCAMITQKWVGLNKEEMEKIYGKLDADPVESERIEQATENLNQAA